MNIVKVADHIKVILKDQFNSYFDGKKNASLIDGDITFTNSLVFHITASVMSMNSGGLVTKKIKVPKLFQIFSSVIEGMKQKVLIIRFIDP